MYKLSISTVFNNKQPFIAYITAGHISVEQTIESILSLERAGVDIIELGVPFSDPVADGPVIQQAMTRALKQQITFDDVIYIIEKVREHSAIPLVLFSYYNPILKHGEHFYQRSQQAGVDAILVVDLPLEEMTEHIQLCQSYNLQIIPLITNTMALSRVKESAALDSPFLYYVSRKGVTGVQAQSNIVTTKAHLAKVKEVAQKPVAIGFGIGCKNSAKEALAVADGFVVGSYIVNLIEQALHPEQIETLVKKIDPR
ncbi:Tryptophan synthase alpha chain [Piscirickettsia salmonis]|uniref:Tryptophan synthase alpha chain n=1 Tax=Piscirickettsia salmonis TaxID=1238 RepID=A0A1L6TFG7_PISSA|nr:tryptophan synthase subunit alpha [Piscirickettsia salmonis]AKP72317.2 tryptophan synthase subunit alpha [Piscirickettsia salmonis LF-89 = ATCC VR-1361]ALB24237.1 tryptophan synthase, alpha subunit [Piscirickettsia salmonis]ALY04031.1 tryptophan synthase subunit alpha [Piscirickettsia salmonis]AMA43595.1 tryptophan synthase subunit alpha [Piscirickettsia salmonis]AOS36064.1 tryptophan synthase subunit alpha [Piscirickettsia salmonis]